MQKGNCKEGRGGRARSRLQSCNLVVYEKFRHMLIWHDVPNTRINGHMFTQAIFALATVSVSDARTLDPPLRTRVKISRKGESARSRRSVATAKVSAHLEQLAGQTRTYGRCLAACFELVHFIHDERAARTAYILIR